MFNFSEVMPAIQKAIDDRPLSESEFYVLLIRDGIFLCRPATVPVKPEEFLFSLTAEQAEQGLSCRDWTVIADKISRLIMRGVRCQAPYKP
jgi:hypothetical protein